MKDLVNVGTIHESGMNQINVRVSGKDISKSNQSTENDTKSRPSVAPSKIRAHSGLKLKLNLKKATNVKINYSESESSKETTSYMRDKSCERHSKGKDDIGECIKVINENFKIVENSTRRRSPSREKPQKVPTNGVPAEEKSYARCTRSRALKILHPSKETNISVKSDTKRRSPSREKSQKSPTPSDNTSRERKSYNRNSSKHEVHITRETKHDAMKMAKNSPQPGVKSSPTKIQRLSERLTAHTESSKRKLRNPNVHDLISTASELHDAEKTAVKKKGEESRHYAKVFEKSEGTHSAREKGEVNIRNTKESRSNFGKKEVVEVTFSKSHVSECFSSSTVKTNASGADISQLLNGAKLLDDESLPIIMNGSNVDIDNLEGTDVDFDPANEGKNDSGMKSSSKIPRKALLQSGMKCNASMKKETTVSFDSGCEDIQL